MLSHDLQTGFMFRTLTGIIIFVDVNECVDLLQPCEFGGQCINTIGGYECICPEGRTGQRCEKGLYCLIMIYSSTSHFLLTAFKFIDFGFKSTVFLLK